MLQNSTTQYGSISKILHWAMSASIIGLVLAGFTMINLKDSALKWQIYSLHKTTGLTIMLLVPIRFIWRISQTAPTLAMLPHREQIGAKWGQYSLYTLMALMPITGWFMSTAAGYPPLLFGSLTWAAPIAKSKATSQLYGQFHWYGAWILTIAVLGHIGLAMKHHWVNHNKILKRMLPGSLNS